MWNQLTAEDSAVKQRETPKTAESTTASMDLNEGIPKLISQFNTNMPFLIEESSSNSH
jgi:hypothetical protein